MGLLDQATSKFLNPIPETVESSEGPRFFIERQLGEGGFGDVYLAEDTRLRRSVAIKILKHDLSLAADAAGAAFEEARALAGVEHPHVVPVYDAGKTEAGEIYLVSKFIDGCSLEDAITKGQLSRDELLQRILEICQALEAVHDAGVIHRDIKPDNILLDPEGKAVLIDFGIAATLGGVKWLAQAGTPAYMSPEQTREQEHLIDSQSDLYSLGAVLYRGLTGDAFSRESAAVTEDFVPLMQSRLDSLDQTLPDGLIAICQKALAVRKSDRYRSASEFGKDLEAILAQKIEPEDEIKDAPVIPRGLKSFDEQDASFFLSLVPGRRDPSSGLPANIHHWKIRIEDRGLSGTAPFRIGLLFGPSGSGKSSLVKAGLLPNLDSSIITIRLDASFLGTEEQFKKVLCARFPHLDASEGLSWLLGNLRRGALPAGAKLLIVIDQFEQWLHANPERMAASVLTKALRQCDGSRIQALITLRDEFWRPAGRFMRELDEPMREGENVAIVEPFDLMHGQKVLASLGRGLGRLDEPLKKNQRTFLEQTVDLASENGRVSPLRLSLLAQIFESREWSSDALAGIRSSEDLGSFYLDQIFKESTGPLKRHPDAARKFLAALLPEKRSLIRADGISREALQLASGLDDSDFQEVVRVLDQEYRLITPIESGYQLSHDYLVRALRHWFSREQKKSLKGLALLRLEDQTAEWLPGDRKKLLPGFIEWIWFRSLTPKAARSAEAQKFIQAANKVYRRKIAFWLSGITAVIISIVALVTHSRAHDAVDRFYVATPDQFADAYAKVRQYSFWTKGRLKKDFQGELNLKKRRRSALLLAGEGETYQEDLCAGLLDADPLEWDVFNKVLHPLSVRNREKMLRVLREGSDPERGIRASCALAQENQEVEIWESEGDRIMIWLDQISQREAWISRIAPVAPVLMEDVLAHTRKGSSTAASLLAHASGADGDALCKRLSLISSKQLSSFQQAFQQLDDGSEHLLRVARDLAMPVEARANSLAILVGLGNLPIDIEVTDSTLNAFLIDRLNSLQTGVIASHLEEATSDPEWARIILLSLARHSSDALSSVELSRIKDQVQLLHGNHSSASIHAAAAYLLEQWGVVPSLPTPPEGADWFYSKAARTAFTILDPSRSSRKLDLRKFAIAQRELTNEVFLDLLGTDKISPTRYTVNPKTSAYVRNLWDAFRVCNELSKRDGLSECYLQAPNKNQFYLREDHATCDGYRIASPLEFEFSCFNDERNPYVFGESSAVIEQYAWYVGNCRKRQRSASLLPNRFGLHDVHGNVGDLVIEPFYWNWKKNSNNQLYEDLLISKALIFGGKFNTLPRNMARPDWSYEIFQAGGDIGNYGLRIVRIIK